ncbi:MAG TPA: tRNA lysidine(34) synthetase TilS, partial [Acidimicrobiia bacterium]|nr:tRNA lysidine(34) synthetase TilS [Acidimicrobiia bacterium]
LHVDHGLPYSPLMAEAARRVAKSLEVPLEVVSTTVPEGASPEGQARSARYRAFAEAVAGREALLTAHTEDDDAETILFNLIRGTGPQGLTGIPAFRPPNIYRPLLAVTRSETLEIATLAGLPYADDPMNQDPTLTRNLLRREVLPVLARLNPRLVPALHRMGQMLARDVEHLDRLAASIRPVTGEGWAAIPLGVLLSRPRPVADRALIDALGALAGRGVVSAERLDRIWSVVRGDAPREEVGGGVIVSRRGAMIVLRLEDAPQTEGLLVLTPGIHRFGGLELRVVSVDAPCRVAPLSKWAAVFPSDVLLEAGADGVVRANGEPAWIPGGERLPVAWYEPGSVGYLSVLVREECR